jgi:hypothetical protein
MKLSTDTAWKRVHRDGRTGGGASRARFLCMILVSVVVLYGLMYLTLFEASHLEFSQLRLWRALAMGAAIALVVLAFMPPASRGAASNASLAVMAAGLLLVSLWCARSQRTVEDIGYLKAMIPHQSISVLVSSRARIHDERVRELADRILESRLREIDEMKRLISELERSPPAMGAPVLRPAAPPRRILAQATEQVP